MSAPKKEEGAKSKERGAKKVWVGSVARRPVEGVLDEMEVLAHEDRRRITTPIPPAPRPPGRFYVTRRPPLPPRPPPINPYVPDSPDRAAIVRAAAVRVRAHQEAEAYLLAEADAAAAAPRKKTPPCDAEDFFDLARWNRRRWL